MFQFHLTFVHLHLVYQISLKKLFDLQIYFGLLLLEIVAIFLNTIIDMSGFNF